MCMFKDVIFLALLFIFLIDDLIFLSCRLWRPSWSCGNKKWTDVSPDYLDGPLAP